MVENTFFMLDITINENLRILHFIHDSDNALKYVILLQLLKV